MATEKRIRHCAKCVNACALDNPLCKTGKKLAEEKGIYEEVEIEEKKGIFSGLFKKKNL